MHTETLKMSEAINLFRGLIEYGNLNDQLPTKLTWAVNRTRRAMQEIAETFDATLKSLAEQYSERDENGEKVAQGMAFKLAPDKIEDYNKAVQELNEGEIEVEVYQVDFEQFPANFSARIMTLLGPIIREPKEEPAVLEGTNVHPLRPSA
jgi:hypothetical protein